MEKPPIQPAEDIAGTEHKLAVTAVDFTFQAERVTELFNMVNVEAKKNLLQGPFGEDDVIGVLELLGRKHPRPSRAGVSIARLVMLLEGEDKEAISEKTSVTRTPLYNLEPSAARIIARELDKVLYPAFLPGEFSPDRRDIFLGQIRGALGHELPAEYRDNEGLATLLGVWAESYDKPDLVDVQRQRLHMLLEGESYPDIAYRTHTNPSNLRRMQRNAARAIAHELTGLPGESLIQEKINNTIDLLIDRGILSQSHASVFKQHVSIGNEPLANGQISYNVDACEKLRIATLNAKVRDRKKRDRKVSNLPTERQQQIFQRLLGNRPDAINPVSRTELIQQYIARQRKLIDSVVLDEKEMQKMTDTYATIVGRAILGNLRWIVNPHYSYENDT
jgi:hypothetical protein